MKADSTLVSKDALIYSPFNSGQRKYPITRVSIHCVVGQTSAVSLGTWFQNKDVEASSNYGIGYDGKIGQYVPESYRSWCTSNGDNDNRAITIECASDAFAPYAVNDKVYKALINLLVDICKRNGKKKLVWISNKSTALAYSVKSDELLMTVHRWFANKSCPGDYLFERHAKIAQEVNAILAGSKVEAKPNTTSTTTTNQNGTSQTAIVKTASLKLRYLARTGYSNPVDQVKVLQRLLNGEGFIGKDGKALVVDGIFGVNTEYAVCMFQTKKKLSVDKVVGPETWGTLLHVS